MKKIILSVIIVLSYIISGYSLSENEKIQILLTKIEGSNLQFVRNGTTYNSKQARDHLEMKLNKAGGKIKTADNFITYIASKSFLTGEPYYIIHPDGKKVKAGTYLKQLLSDIEKNGK